MAPGRICVADLGGEWRFTCIADPRVDIPPSAAALAAIGLPSYPAAVPGNVEIDLHRNGLVEDPLVGMNIAALRSWEGHRFVYSRTFATPAAESGQEMVLVAEGLDCDVEIAIDGEWRPFTDGCPGSGGNALIPRSISLGSLDPGTHEILVAISPHYSKIDPGRFRRGLQAMSANWESLHVRKPPHAYGWDIMPRSLLGGIWRPIRVELVPCDRIDEVYLETLRVAPDRAHATVSLYFRMATDFDPTARYEIAVTGKCGDSRFEARNRALYTVGSFTFDIPEPRCWWPRGRGPADMYDCEVTLLRNGVEIDRRAFRHGIRTVELIRTSVTDEDGNGEFCFRVNGERVFALGTNWVPLDPFHSRDAERLPQAMALVDDIGCNFIRCWGGNVYEGDAFYDACDAAGVLVWQDFAMACALYPQDSEFQDAIEYEARAVVRRLRQHPCIALWSGDNECDAAYLWGGSRRDPNTNVLTRQVLPKVLAEEDPLRPYLPSSPYIDPAAYASGAKYLPEDHLWGPRDYYKSDYYQSALCHFASEIGYHGCPEPASIRRFTSPGRDWPYSDNEEWLLHATSPVPGVNLFDYRVELMANQVRVLFGTVPDNLHDFAFASQASQAEANKFFIEMFRSRKWRRTGIIWWNILDGWPQFSDAVVDYYFARKLAYRYIRTAQQALCLMFREPSDGTQELVIVNDRRDRVAVEFAVTDVDTGEPIVSGTADCDGDSTAVAATVPYHAGRQRCYRIDWPGGANHYVAGPPPYDLETYRHWADSLYGEPGDWWHR